MTDIYPILREYQVNPTEIIAISRRVYKIKTNRHSYALKRSRLTRQRVKQWKHVFEVANKHNLMSVLPIYLTQSGEVFCEHNEEMFYLTPWIETKETDEPEHELESFYRGIAEMHSKTKVEVKVDKDNMERLVNQEKSKIQGYKRKLLRYIETFERRRYMTPFELRVCMQYRDIEKSLSVLDDWYDYYLVDILDEGIVYSSLCHGNLRPSHQLYQSSQSYFINWERCFYGSPMTDLYLYYFHELKYHDAFVDYLIDSLSIYEKSNPLLKNERAFLSIQLLNPTPYLDILDKYSKKEFNMAQPYQIRQLEYAYRRMIHGLRIQGHLYQVREEIKMKELEKENETESQD